MVPEPTSIGRCDLKLQLMWQCVDARSAPCLDLELVCGVPTARSFCKMTEWRCVAGREAARGSGEGSRAGGGSVAGARVRGGSRLDCGRAWMTSRASEATWDQASRRWAAQGRVWLGRSVGSVSLDDTLGDE
jgi:hypothetical protein